MQTISICAIYKNEENKIVRYLRHIKGLADEIILVDTGSDKIDLTGAIAKLIYPETKLFYHQFNNDFSEIRNFAISKATKEWILILDLDEIILQKDHKKIRDLLDKTDCDLIAFPRRHWRTLGMTMEYKPPYPDYHLRIFKNNKKIHYVNMVHESLTGHTKTFHSKDIEIQHFNICYKSHKKFMEDHNLYKRLTELQKEGSV